MEQKVAHFQIGDLLPIAITLVVVGIALVYGIEVVDDVKDDIGATSCSGADKTYNDSNGECYNSTGNYAPEGKAWLSTNDTGMALAKLPEKLPTIVTIIIAAVIIGILLRYFLRRF